MTPIYHITHINNLTTIVSEGGLWCDYERQERNLNPIGIAHTHIKVRRAKRPVPCAAKGTLANYVPWYFAPRSPMLYSIRGGYVAGYNEGQSRVLHLVTSVDLVVQEQLIYTFTDGHAEIEFSQFYTDPKDLDQIDWNIMAAIYWSDTNDDPDRKRRRQAEFLIHRFLPWSLIEEIGVMTPAAADAVRDNLRDASHKPRVIIHRDWYY